MRHSLCLSLSLALALSAAAQTTNPLPKVAEDFQKKLDAVTRQLATTRSQIEEEKVPMTRQLNELDDKVIEARKEYDRVLRIADTRQLDVTNLRAQIKAKEDQTNYIANAVDEFIRNMETRLHISEAQRYGDTITARKNAANNANLSAEERLQARMDLLMLAVDRLEDVLGGTIFDGSAVEGKSGIVSEGKFLVMGPLAFFAGNDGRHMGLADLRLGSLEPAILTLPPETRPEDIRTTLAAGEGSLPVDSTRGSAFKIEETKMTVWQEFLKGGPVMWPIGILGAVALLVGLVKWLQLWLVRRPGHRQISALLEHLDAGRFQEAGAIVRRTGGPVGRMLDAVLKHYRDPVSMMEESMFERVLDAKTRLNAYIPFIKIAAAVEPLLGLLGTVTGMINTFKLITVFGTQDASTFSSGISEALLTTEWGLITAIPCLLMAAFLARMSKAIQDDMEKLGVRILNHRNAKDILGAAPRASEPPAKDDPAPGALPAPAV
ncbi:MAG TPA: hypothetical protein DIT13_01295 [Verrucomicrobiales bacterium]|nr:hypothetical protein [Verrucomicrobiales bacterium]HRJ09057.1 MotA/TolQ/ExbB proton channel family protein [Prosthecobacter sp.]HRK15346.1 MotA/TolQ/ExbB proton channel family protein [Prosthecobacter sp.]